MFHAKYQDDNITSVLDYPSLKHRHMIDLFDRAQIYGTFQSVLTSFDYNRDFHCFYFGLNDFPRLSNKFTVQNSHNRNFMLEEILHTVSIIFKLTSISLTYVSLRKLCLITKETMKTVYLNPNDSKLLPLSTAITQRRQISGFITPKLKLDEKALHYEFNCSLNDDLEDLLESIRTDGFKADSKHIFFTKLLTASEMKQLKSKDENFTDSFYRPEFDVSTEMMLKSNSTSKYDFWSGFRTTVNIPAKDYPFIDEPGFFLSPHGNYWVDPYMDLEDVAFGEHGEFAEYIFTPNITMYSNHRPLNSNIHPGIYCQDYDSLQYFDIHKKAGEYEVVIDEEYVNAYYLVDLDALEPDSFIYMYIIQK